MERFKISDCDSYRGEELKNILRARGEKLSGSHSDLCKRVVDDINDEIDLSNQKTTLSNIGTLGIDLEFCLDSFLYDRKCFIVCHDPTGHVKDYSVPVMYSSAIVYEFDLEKLDIVSSWSYDVSFTKLLFWNSSIYFFNVKSDNVICWTSFNVKTKKFVQSLPNFQVDEDFIVHSSTAVIFLNTVYVLCSRTVVRLKDDARCQMVESFIYTLDLNWKSWKRLPNSIDSDTLSELYGFVGPNDCWYFMSKSCSITCMYNFKTHVFDRRNSQVRNVPYVLYDYPAIFLRKNALWIHGGLHDGVDTTNRVLILNIDTDVITVENLGLPSFHHCIIQKDDTKCLIMGGLGWKRRDRSLFTPIRSIFEYEFPYQLNLEYLYAQSILVDSKIIIDGKRFKMHRLIMSQCPKLFRITELETTIPTFDAFCQWLYGNDILDKNQLPALKKLGIVLESSELVSYCTSLESLEPIDNSRRIQKLFKNLFASDEYYDVVLITKEGEKFRAHKMILSLSSEYFYIMFTSKMQESKQKRILCEEISSKSMGKILRWIYKKKFDIPDDFDEAIDLMKASKFVLITQLDQMICREIIAHITRDNVFEILDHVTHHNTHETIRNACVKFIEENYEKREIIEFYIETRNALPYEETKVNLHKRKRKLISTPRKK